eukprot:g77255.t1
MDRVGRAVIRRVDKVIMDTVDRVVIHHRKGKVAMHREGRLLMDREGKAVINRAVGKVDMDKVGKTAVIHRAGKVDIHRAGKTVVMDREDKTAVMDRAGGIAAAACSGTGSAASSEEAASRGDTAGEEAAEEAAATLEEGAAEAILEEGVEEVTLEEGAGEVGGEAAGEVTSEEEGVGAEETGAGAGEAGETSGGTGEAGEEGAGGAEEIGEATGATEAEEEAGEEAEEAEEIGEAGDLGEGTGIAESTLDYDVGPLPGREEEDTGITSYLTDTKGFRAILKQRYEDFHVHEIDKNGEVIHLTSFQEPAEETGGVEGEGEAAGQAAVAELVGEETAAAFVQWIHKARAALAKRKAWNIAQRKLEERESARQFDKRMAQRAAFLRTGQEGEEEQPAEAESGPSVPIYVAGAASSSAASAPEATAAASSAEKAEETPAASAASLSSSKPPPPDAPSPFEFTTANMDKEQRKKLHETVRHFWGTDLHTYTELPGAKEGRKRERPDTAAQPQPPHKKQKTETEDESMQTGESEASTTTETAETAAASDEQASQETQETPNILVQFHTQVYHKDVRWPSSRPEYLRCVLHKSNWDTMFAVDALARQLRLPIKHISYAGTKDKRAVTSQVLHVRMTPAQRLLGAVSKLHGLSVGNFSYVPQPLKLGDLRGNRFRLVLRSCQGDTTQIQQTVQQLGERGFVNYYGMQRFGTGPVVTHAIGRAVLRADWNRAVALLLMPAEEKGAADKASKTEETGQAGKTEEVAETSKAEETAQEVAAEAAEEGDKAEQQPTAEHKAEGFWSSGQCSTYMEDLKKSAEGYCSICGWHPARHTRKPVSAPAAKPQAATDKLASVRALSALAYFRETRDAQGAIGKLAPHERLEQRVLQVLANQPNQFKQAFEALPRQRRQLYTHAFQSFVWNRLASTRLSELGHAVVVGDLVLCSTAARRRAGGETDGEKAAEQADAEGLEADDAWLEGGGEEADDQERSGKRGGLSTEGLYAKLQGAVEEVTAEDVAAGYFKLWDVVLPLPGYAVKLPGNVMAERYRDILREQGVRFAAPKVAVEQKSKNGVEAKEGGQEAEAGEGGAAEAAAGDAEGQDSQEQEQLADESGEGKPEAQGEAEAEAEAEAGGEEGVACNTSREYALPGSYRPLAVRPAHLSWKLRRYSDYTIPLLQTDLDRLHGVPEPTSNENEEGPELALCVEFSLPCGTYATMCLREILKESTTKAFHKSLSSGDS